jgi:recombination protein RecT
MLPGIQVIVDLIYGARDQFAAVSQRDSLVFEKEAAFAVQVFQNNEYALQLGLKNQQSVIDALINVAAIGVSLNPARKQAHLVPRDGRISLDISYMGLIDIATDTGSIHWAQAYAVHQHDKFVFNGAGNLPTHNCDPFSKDRGDVVGVYVVAKTNDGDYLTHTMSTDMINAIRDRSVAWKAWVSKKRSCPWVTDWLEMAKKTCVKQACTYWPRDRADRLADATSYLNTDGNEGIELAPQQPQQPQQATVDVVAAEAEIKAAQSAQALDALFQKWGQVASDAKDKAAYVAIRTAVREAKTKIGA